MRSIKETKKIKEISDTLTRHENDLNLLTTLMFMTVGAVCLLTYTMIRWCM